ncbi:hypothetical protein HZH66_002602 [Vespula vulgaris]|uniref:Uncharacterized protein n=1 Tax=Vespula vulgaris TaxID=7454 RepID=A0A834NGE1_VESVU|nr:hypothetical protein HZH66_002602 [Vespula vulgaris]
MDIYPGNMKITAIKNFPTPKNKKAIQSFLKLMEYFHKFIILLNKQFLKLLRKDLFKFEGKTRGQITSFEWNKQH